MSAPDLLQGLRDLCSYSELSAQDRKFLRDAAAELSRLRAELAKANNEFGSEAADWPGLWQRIAGLKDLAQQRWVEADGWRAELAALKQQEPVAWKLVSGHGTAWTDSLLPEHRALTRGDGCPMWMPLYAAPVPAADAPQVEVLREAINHAMREALDEAAKPAPKTPFAPNDWSDGFKVGMQTLGMIVQAAMVPTRAALAGAAPTAERGQG